jgi:hypothetical protein
MVTVSLKGATENRDTIMNANPCLPRAHTAKMKNIVNSSGIRTLTILRSLSPVLSMVLVGALQLRNMTNLLHFTTRIHFIDNRNRPLVSDTFLNAKKRIAKSKRKRKRNRATQPGNLGSMPLRLWTSHWVHIDREFSLALHTQ